jgi:hypothetical protein
MLIFNWWITGEWIVALTMVLLAIFGLRFAGKLRALALRVVVRIASVALGLVGSLLALLLFAVSGCESHSAPIYSPSGTMAARIENADEGATGGQTLVELYWAHGFERETVYDGGWKSVEPSDIKWTNDSELKILYSGGYAADSFQCKSTAGVKVSCLPR